MALTEQDIKKITDEIVRTLTAGLAADAPLHVRDELTPAV